MDPSNQDILLEYRKNNFAPIPQLSLDSIIVLFLKKYEVYVTPPQSSGVDLSDRLLFSVVGPVAMMNTGLKNQIRSSEKSEWISWKQWALSHPEFNDFKCNAISNVDIYNSRLQKYLQSDEGIDVIASIKRDRRRKERNQILCFMFILVSVYILMFIYNTFEYTNRDKNLEEIRKSVQIPPNSD
jgi:hypothetical protein